MKNSLQIEYYFFVIKLDGMLCLYFQTSVFKFQRLYSEYTRTLSMSLIVFSN